MADVNRILIADDHALFRSGLSLLLQRLFDGVDIVEARDLTSTLEAITDSPAFELVLLDLAMPGMKSWDGITSVREHADGAAVVMLSAHEDPAAIRASIEAGASGYLLKSFTEDSLRHALALILSGETYVPSSALFTGSGAAVGRDGSASQTPSHNPSDPLRSLTKRQYDVLMLVMRGHSNKAIARELGVYESTVKAHIQVILQKLHAENRTHAAMIAREWAGAGLPTEEPRAEV